MKVIIPLLFVALCLVIPTITRPQSNSRTNNVKSETPGFSIRTRSKRWIKVVGTVAKNAIKKTWNGYVGKPSETDSVKSQTYPRHLVGKRTAQKDAIKDITSGSQVNSCFPYRWSPASLSWIKTVSDKTDKYAWPMLLMEIPGDTRTKSKTDKISDDSPMP